MVSKLRWRQCPSKSEREITEDSWERTKGSVYSSSLFKFTKGEVEEENIIKMAQQRFLVVYLKISSMGILDLRVEGKAYALVVISSAIMERSVWMEETHLLMKIKIILGTSSIIRGMRSNAGYQGNGQLFKESKEHQVWRIKCCFW